MDNFASMVENFGVYLALLIVAVGAAYKFFMDVYKAQREDKKDAEALYIRHVESFTDQVNKFDNTVNNINKTNIELAETNKILVNSIKDDLQELKHTVNDIKNTVDNKVANPQNNPNI